jgi:hypothetical protein
MGLFEENPLLMVPLVLAIVVVYDLAKHSIIALSRRSRTPGRQRE